MDPPPTELDVLLHPLGRTQEELSREKVVSNTFAYPLSRRQYPTLRKTAAVGDQRNSVFTNDPYVRKFDSERVLCKLCESWISLGTDDSIQAVQTWVKHKTVCQQSKTPSTSAAGPR